MRINFTLNNQPAVLDAPADKTVVRVLREDFGLLGVKECCGEGECGGCTILVDGRSRLSCLMLAAQLEGRRITTIEGLAKSEDIHYLQEAFVRHGAVQCGYCTPGMILAAASLLNENPRPSRSQIREALSGNICRCTGYHKIVDAVAAAAEELRETARES